MLIQELGRPLDDQADLRRLSLVLDGIAVALAERTPTPAVTADELAIDSLLAALEDSCGLPPDGATAARNLAQYARQASYDSSDDEEYEEPHENEVLERANEEREKLVEVLGRITNDDPIFEAG